jgi:hypothetical protein
MVDLRLLVFFIKKKKTEHSNLGEAQAQALDYSLIELQIHSQ